MSRRRGVLERVPAAYFTPERQAILETGREFAMKEVLPIANRLDPVDGEIPSELALERYWRDARLTKIFEGTSEIQQRIISDGYLPRPPRSSR